MCSNNSTTVGSENAVSLKLPVFWISQPQVWFEQAEAQLCVRQITSDTTRYYYVVSALDQHTAGRIIDLLRQPPATDKYKAIKTLLTTLFAPSETERAARLLHMDGLGDRTPSQLMSEMLAFLDGHEPCFLFRQIFLEQIPIDIRLLLSDVSFKDPRQLAIHADALWQAKQQDLATLNPVRTQRRNTSPSQRPLLLN
uniref:DUF7041 domain-containing protein n=1 Tax=Trichuris muris TaxID=70415 RepID=A0A5S6Q6D1_TRIMR